MNRHATEELQQALLVHQVYESCLDEFLRRQKPALAPGASAVRTLVDERMAGR